MTTKRARPHFRVGEFASGQPWIIMECYDGDNLALFEKTVGFDLRPGISYEEAQRIVRLLKENLIAVNES
ncbi:hypothetical protein [Bradyrhizobium glycinis]|uniref:hypothetical protein n=1 Tax=Bradyrhizobium glycinis TaxID=2751812 RepID=UPI0018D6879C|nr:hypothetical protein [Bradyrhizobium glycinis]MBH5372958.1 hypothetical protein [Bradyrhizobium glycinis]